MAYIRQEGTEKVYEYDPAAKRVGKHVSYEEAVAKDIWGQIKDVKDFTAPSLADILPSGAWYVDKPIKEPISGVEIENGEGGGEVDLGGAPTDLTDIEKLATAITGATKTYEDVQAKIAEAQKVAIERADKRAEEAATKKETYWEKVTGALKEREEYVRPSQKDLLTTTLKEWGLTPEAYEQRTTLTGQLADYQTKMNNIDLALAQREMATEQMGMPLEFIQGRKALYVRQAAIEKSGIAAQAGVVQMQISALDQKFADAKQMASMVVSAATYDEEMKVKDLEWAFSAYADLFSAMDKEEKDAWGDAYKIAMDTLNTKKEDAQQIMNLVLEAAKEGVALTLDPTGSLTDAVNLFNATMVAKAEEAKTEVETKEERDVINGLMLEYNKMGAGITEADTIETAISKASKAGATEYDLKIARDRVELAKAQVDGVGVRATSADAWLKLIATGQADISNVPSGLRNQVITGLADLIPDPTNEDWVRNQYNEGKTLGKSDEEIREDMRKSGVSDFLINKIIPLKPYAPPKTAVEVGGAVGEAIRGGVEAIPGAIWGGIKGVGEFIKGIAK